MCLQKNIFRVNVHKALSLPFYSCFHNSLGLAWRTYFLFPFPFTWCNHKGVSHSIPLIILLQEYFHICYSVLSEFWCLVSVQDMVKVSFHFVHGKSPKNFASTLVNFMGKVSSHFSHLKQFSLTWCWDTFWCLVYCETLDWNLLLLWQNVSAAIWI